MENFRKGIELGLALYPFLTQELMSLEPDHTISIGTYQRSGVSDNPDLLQSGYLITKGELFEPGFHQICAAPAQDKNLKDSFFYYEPGANEVRFQKPSIFHQYPALADAIRKFYGLGIISIYVFASLSYFEFWSTTLTKRPILFVGIVLIFAAVLVYLHSSALFPMAWERTSLDMKDAIYRGGFSYRIPIGIDWMDRRDLGESPAIIYENGNPLRHPNATPFAIKQRGKGRFSIEKGYLINVNSG